MARPGFELAIGTDRRQGGDLRMAAGKETAKWLIFQQTGSRTVSTEPSDIRACNIAADGDCSSGPTAGSPGGTMLSQGNERGSGMKLVCAARDATLVAESILRDATVAVRERLSGTPDAMERLFEREQRATHGLAWLATYVEAIRQITAYAERMHGAGALGELEQLLIRIGLGEYLAQIAGGIPMSQGEFVRPADLGLAAEAGLPRPSRPPPTIPLGPQES